jgi:hypothetical protein
VTCTVAEILDTDSKLCGTCGVVRPLGQFRRIRKDGVRRHRECNECRRRYERRRRRLKKGLTALRQHQDPDKVNILAGALIRGCGGLKHLIMLTRRAFEDSKQPSFKFQALSAILHLLEIAEKLNNDQGPPLERMSNTELKQKLDMHLAAMIARKPDLAANFLRDQGWTVIPPGDKPMPE